MKGKLIWSIFWALVGVFIIVISIFLIPVARESLLGPAFLLGSGILFVLLGAVLIYLTAKDKVTGLLNRFLILTGASATAMPVSAVLHNPVYGLFIYWFGTDFWDRIGLGDEPVFFIMAVLVCPIGFLVGAVGSIVLAKKKA